MIIISASTNPPKLSDLPAYIEKLNTTAVDYIHCDVMDGQFVHAVTFSHKTVAQIKKLTPKPLDVHLMTTNPQKTFKKYIAAGASILTVHFEVFKNKKKLLSLLSKIRKHGAFAGVSFRPSTPIKEVLFLAPFCDVFLVMSVEPGKSGQQFLPVTFSRLAEIKRYLKANSLEVTIEIDGGVTGENLPELIKKGADMAVMGNHLFTAKNLLETVANLKAL